MYNIKHTAHEHIWLEFLFSPRNVIWSVFPRTLCCIRFSLLSVASFENWKQFNNSNTNARCGLPSYVGSDFYSPGQMGLQVHRGASMSGAGWRRAHLTKAFKRRHSDYSKSICRLAVTGLRGAVAIYSNNCLSKHWAMQSLGKPGWKPVRGSRALCG